MIRGNDPHQEKRRAATHHCHGRLHTEGGYGPPSREGGGRLHRQADEEVASNEEAAEVASKP